MTNIGSRYCWFICLFFPVSTYTMLCCPIQCCVVQNTIVLPVALLSSMMVCCPVHCCAGQYTYTAVVSSTLVYCPVPSIVLSSTVLCWSVQCCVVQYSVAQDNGVLSNTMLCWTGVLSSTMLPCTVLCPV